jgi:hypothetical protein
VVRLGPAFAQNVADIEQRLARLRGEAVGKYAVRVPADDAAGEHETARRRHAVGVAFGLRPALRLEHLRPAGRAAHLGTAQGHRHCSW